MKKLFLVLFVFVCTVNYAARISGNYEADICQKMYIGIYQRGSYHPVDSVILDSQGHFSTVIPDSLRGMLLIACANDKPAKQALNEADNTSSLLFIFDGQDITYNTSWRWHSEYLDIKEGGETTLILQQIYRQRVELHRHLAALESVIDKTNERSELFSMLTKEYSNLIKFYNAKVQNVINVSVPESMFRVSLENMLEPETPAYLRGELRIAWLREHFFNGTPLDNVLLYNDPAFTHRLRQYLYVWLPKGLVSETEIAVRKEKAIGWLKLLLSDADESVIKALDETFHNMQNQ
jgi:hypothetical protein